MKKVLLALAILALATPVFAADAYVALFSDIDHSVCSVNFAAPFVMFDCWIFMTSHLGVQAAEYRIVVPTTPTVVAQIPVTNPEITVSLGDPIAGISVSFGTCQTGWVWSQRIPCYLMGAQAGYMMIEAKPGVGLQIASCETGFPIYSATVLNHLALNNPCEIATEDASWGAIKSLF